MKTLEDYGRKVTVHKNQYGPLIKRVCTCGQMHFLRKQEGNRYIRCKCERLVRI